MVTLETGQRILIIDDDKEVLQILAKILQRAGYVIDAVETGREALERIRTNRYDVALIDVRLQDMNGLDLLDLVQKAAPKMTKIVMTGFPSNEDRARASERGANFYLMKPVKSEKLIEIIRQETKRSVKLEDPADATPRQLQQSNTG